MRYSQKTILITGAAAGIGRHLASAFAAEGGQVLLADLDETAATHAAQQIVASGGRAMALHMDVADETDVQQAVQRVLAAGGEIDVLLNNAGIAYGDIYQLTTIPADRLRRVLDVNVLGMLFCARACRDSLRRRGGCIVNTSSMSSYMANGAYGLSKATVNNLTLALADELAGDGIRVNAIAPGLMDSPAAMAHVSAVLQNRIRAAQLVQRQGHMQDVAELALFLASPQTAGFISGQVVLVDGGYLRHSASAMPVPLAAATNG